MNSIERMRERRPRSTKAVAFRWIQLVAGLFLYGLAVTLMVRSTLGLGPWDAFHEGIHRLTGMSIGLASILVGLVIIIGNRFLSVRPQVGTLANMVLIGVFIDLLLPVVPAADGWVWGLAYHLPAVLLVGLATGMYMGARMGEGPRDGLMVGLATRTGLSVRLVRTGIELSTLLLGWLMGGTLGLGTIIFALGIGPAVQWSIELFGGGRHTDRYGPHGGERPTEADSGHGLQTPAASGTTVLPVGECLIRDS